MVAPLALLLQEYVTLPVPPEVLAVAEPSSPLHPASVAIASKPKAAGSVIVTEPVTEH